MGDVIVTSAAGITQNAASTFPVLHSATARLQIAYDRLTMLTRARTAASTVKLQTALNRNGMVESVTGILAVASWIVKQILAKVKLLIANWVESSRAGAAQPSSRA